MQSDFSIQEAQLTILKKKYRLHGLELKITSSAMPEQYDVFKDGSLVGYYRLRHGEFTVDYLGNTVYTCYDTIGDGIFDGSERPKYMVHAMNIIISALLDNTG